MCGIMGYAGYKNAVGEVYGGLLRLEYRGYDSAGIAALRGGKIFTAKRAGRVEKLLPLIENMSANVAMGHTRWATHGGPSDKNAHPHTAKNVAIVHNGIIENYAELKEELLKEGAKFYSQTDSEIAAALVSKYLKSPSPEGLIKALCECAERLKGAYAVIAMCEGVEGFAVAKMKSPVVLGAGEGENFCASDEPALAGKCPKRCLPEDGDIAFVTREKIQIFDSCLRPVQRKFYKNLALSAELELGDCPHYMLKELKEAPAAVKNTISAYKEAEGSLLAALKGAEKIIFTGCGTAYHAALAGRFYAECAGADASAEYAGELRYGPSSGNKKIALVAVSQSGETADTLEAARLYKSMGAKVIAVTNSPRSQITRISDCVVPVCAGTEICVAATKSYSGQIAALCLLSKTLEKIIGKGNNSSIYAGQLGETDMEILPEIIKNAINNCDVKELSRECAKSKDVYFLGRGLDYALALEGSLKLKEVSYLSGSGYPAGELKHGTLALIDGGALCIFIMCDERLLKKTSSAVYEVLARGGRAAVITTLKEAYDEFCGRAKVILLPECPALLSPPVAAAALHSLAYETAIYLGRNPDKPRNLAKSVTVE